MESSADLRDLKPNLRRRAEAAREEQADKDAVSERICRRLASLPEYGPARTVMLYVAVRNEVRTDPLLSAALAEGKRVVVPYCDGDELGLFVLASLEELAAGTLGIPEPRPELRAAAGKRADPDEIDVAMVPGIAFDRQGGRLGHGRGFFDRFLPRLRADAVAVGVAFECQLLPEIPMLAHDVSVDRVVTEKGIYLGRGRPRGCEGAAGGT